MSILKLSTNLTIMRVGMRADLAIETPVKFFIVLVVAALLVGLIRNIYNQANRGIEDLVPDENPSEYELIELGAVSSGQLASMVDSCWEIGQTQKATQKEFGCFIVKGSFSSANAADVAALSSRNVTVDIPPGANALFVVYDFSTQSVIVRG